MHRSHLWPFGLAICALLTVAPTISAGDEVFRCGSSIVSTELSVSELLEKCGEPSSRQVSTEDVRVRVAKGGTQKVGTTTVEKWRYERSRAAPMVVTIADGKIQSIERGQ
jgi:hypothetical protein